MIECELCGNYFHADDVKACPVCFLELCPDCYEDHVINCLAAQNDNMDGYDGFESSIPTVCPECGADLEYDINSDSSMTVYCPDCDFSQKVDEELLEQMKLEYDDFN